MLAGIKSAYYEAVKEFGEDAFKLCQRVTLFSRDIFHIIQRAQYYAKKKHPDRQMFLADLTYSFFANS